MNHPRPILIAGPTASGKSSLSLKLAQKHDGVIINADALQVYGCYEVLTARPSAQDLKAAPHHLYGHQPNVIGYSVGTWLIEVAKLLSHLDKTPIIIGGTGLYFKALLEGLAIIPETEAHIREKVTAEFDAMGLEHIQTRLRSVDPIISARIDMANHRRVMRALEVYDQTERVLSSWQDDTPPPLLKADECEKIVVMPDVETTNARIANRFEKMMDMGALEEVRSQLPFDPKLPANKALGAREIAAYLDGELSKDDAIEQSIVLTRQYAKRQRSWFRSNMQDWELRTNPT